MNNTISIKAKGHSMMPLIVPGDSLQIHKVDANTFLSWGDIIVFLYKGELIAHRIILRLSNRIITKGDNSYQKETLYSRKGIVGKVIVIKKRQGSIHFDKISTQLAQYYLTFFSLSSFILPFALYRCLLFIFGIRSFLIWLILEKKK